MISGSTQTSASEAIQLLITKDSDQTETVVEQAEETVQQEEAALVSNTKEIEETSNGLLIDGIIIAIIAVIVGAIFIRRKK